MYAVHACLDQGHYKEMEHVESGEKIYTKIMWGSHNIYNNHEYKFFHLFTAKKTAKKKKPVMVSVPTNGTTSSESVSDHSDPSSEYNSDSSLNEDEKFAKQFQTMRQQNVGPDTKFINTSFQNATVSYFHSWLHLGYCISFKLNNYLR